MTDNYDWAGNIVIDKELEKELQKAYAPVGAWETDKEVLDVKKKYNFQEVKVWDSIPGSGKTSKAIEMFNNNYKTKKYIFITPFLNEVSRVVKACPNLNFKQPTTSYAYPSKKLHFLHLIEEGSNIASTHSLFLGTGLEMMEALRKSNYVLVLDEVVSALNKYSLYNKTERRRQTPQQLENLTRRDIDALIVLGVMSVGETGNLMWGENKPTLGRYDDLKYVSEHDMLYYIGNKALMWSFPVSVFEKDVFSDIYILTYQFESQMLSAYFSYFGLSVTKYYVKEGLADDYVVVPLGDTAPDLEFRARLKGLINIVDSEKMNAVGFPDNKKHGFGKLSYTWWQERSSDSVDEISRNVTNFFKNIAPSERDERMWTVFVDNKKDIKAHGATDRNWVAFNARATNDFRHKKSLVYLVNRYFSPSIKMFFQSRGVELDQDAWALSELLQWLFRSAIRDGEEVHLYIPSFRMRELLKAYLKNKPLNSIYDNDIARQRASKDE